MLPVESNPPDFVLPPDFISDATNILVFEENQVDAVIFNHLDDDGNLPAEGTLLNDQFVGIGMGNNGIMYEDIEVLTFNFGAEIDLIRINGTSEAIHVGSILLRKVIQHFVLLVFFLTIFCPFFSLPLSSDHEPRWGK